MNFPPLFHSAFHNAAAKSIVPQGEPANQLDEQSILKHVDDSGKKWLI
jgi:hypothetical protein